MQIFHMKLKACACWKAFCIVRSESFHDERHTNPMSIKSTFFPICRINQFSDIILKSYAFVHINLIYTYVSGIAIAVMKNLFHHFFIMALVWFIYFLGAITVVTICRVRWRAFCIRQAQICFLDILKEGYRKKTRSYRKWMNLIFNRIRVMRVK